MAEPLLLETPLAGVAAFSVREQKALAKAGFERVGELITHFPRRYEDRRHFDVFPTGETTAAVCLHGRITDCGLRRFGYKKYAEVKVEAADAHALAAPIYCRWFNMPWIAKAFAAGQEIVVFGRVKIKKSRLIIDHPDFEVIDPEAEQSIHMDRIVAIYPLRDGLTQKLLRETLHALTRFLDWSTVGELLPATAFGGNGSGLTEASRAPGASRRSAAFRDIHFPDSLAAAQAARQHLALEEFFALQLNVLERRNRIVSQIGTSHRSAGTLLRRWKASLSFSLTAAQERVIGEVRDDMAAPAPMNRLLQGDVGSGKTFVALAAALVAVESGSQAAIMAPTQILAEQHFLNFRHHLDPLGIRLSLRTAARCEESFLPLFQGGNESPHIVVGTHALLFEETLFDRLGLVVIDEQHKFGVAQRMRLVRQGRAPDVLVMTATPIPRTLALTLYGDLDVSLLDEMPPGRGKITTAVRSGVEITQVAAFVDQQLARGRQAFIVYPLIEESEKIEVQAASSGHQTWQALLPKTAVGILHGRLKSTEKEAVMGAFRAGEIRVLVSTTVVEVGIDVANASLIVVFNAERFGLAQLHQLRGRVGRAEHASFCVLICSENSPEAVQRLKILEETRDGFQIAEADLQLRGPGELLGQKQSGLPGLRLGDLAADAPLVHRARELAAAVLAQDPALENPAHRHLRQLILDTSALESIN
ncbi:MAG: ATP-dependent DNA helicase RecG [Verrucomicrobiales bacterium]